ncbi:outer membrane protein assembly factor BamB [Thiocapsa bogorovii]|uniref:outer membrane protein assembly factor BamB n=1 Tax=Thiocapsa bogorovii TaxID=521689 RepID=UPI001E606A7C|nr:outer membrane protein assembly factor BamB [Thiocapsa bogorovii]UHD14842.1 outer membrane protein assembly factor BamB [Thiocapsa bogorovii]
MVTQSTAGAARLGTLLLAGLLGGCGMFPWLGADKDPTPPTKLTEIVQTVGLNTLWSERVTRGTRERRLYLVPVISENRIFVADSRGRLVAVAADSGRVLWERDTDLHFSGGPDVKGERLVIGTSRGELVAFSSRDGNELWRTQLGSEVLSVPRLTDTAQVIVHTLDDSIYGIDANTGAQQWRLNYPAPVLTLRGSSSPVVTPAGILVGLSGGKLLNLDPPDGTPLWEVAITRPSGRSELSRIADIDADPVVIGTIAFVGSYNGDLAAVDITTGTVIWRRELSAHAGLAADTSDLFVTDSSDQIWGADPSDGAGRWRQEGLRYRQVTAPALVGNLIAVGDLDGYVHLLARSDGRLVGRTRVTGKGAITARPLVVGNRLYVFADDGTLAALSVGAAPSAKMGLRGSAPADAGAASRDVDTAPADSPGSAPPESSP